VLTQFLVDSGKQAQLYRIIWNPASLSDLRLLYCVYAGSREGKNCLYPGDSIGQQKIWTLAAEPSLTPCNEPDSIFQERVRKVQFPEALLEIVACRNVKI